MVFYKITTVTAIYCWLSKAQLWHISGGGDKRFASAWKHAANIYIMGKGWVLAKPFDNRLGTGDIGGGGGEGGGGVAVPLLSHDYHIKHI